MDFIIYNGLIPSDGPTQFNVKVSKVKGDDTFCSESGIDNTNIIRTKKHNISIKYENIPLKVLEEITNEINKDVVNVDYFFGTMQNGDFQVEDMNIDLVFCEYDKYGISNSYWNLSFELKEF